MLGPPRGLAEGPCPSPRPPSWGSHPASPRGLEEPGGAGLARDPRGWAGRTPQGGGERQGQGGLWGPETPPKHGQGARTLPAHRAASAALVMLLKLVGWSGGELADGGRQLKRTEANPRGRTRPACSHGSCPRRAAVRPPVCSGLASVPAPVTAAGTQALCLRKSRRNYSHARVLYYLAAVASLGIYSA